MTDVVAFAVADVTLPTAPTCFLMMIGRGEAFFGNGCRKKGTDGVGIAFTRLVARGRTDLGMSHFPGGGGEYEYGFDGAHIGIGWFGVGFVCKS